MKKTFKQISVVIAMVMLLLATGSSMAVSAQETVSVTACEDTVIGGWTSDINTTRGADVSLLTGGVLQSNGTIDLGGSGYPYMAYFKFNLPAGVSEGTKSIENAKLKLYIKNTKTWNVEMKKMAFYATSDNSWNEATLINSTAPIKSNEVSIGNVSGKIAPGYLESYSNKNISSTSWDTLEYNLTDFINTYDLLNGDGKISIVALPIVSEIALRIATKDRTEENLRPVIEFTLGDIAPLAVTTPPASSCNYKGNVEISFNNSLKASSVTGENVELYKNGELVTIGSDELAVGGNGKSIVISTAKQPFESYMVKLKSGLCDVYGSALAETEYSFTTVLPDSEAKIDYSGFLTAMYLPTNPDHTGDRTSPGTGGNTGWLPELYASGVYRQYYGKIDISSLAGKSIEKVEYNLFINGYINISLYRVDGDFTPGTTKYSELPTYGKKIANIIDRSTQNGRYVKLDLTEYTRELLLNNKTSLGFMIKQEEPNQASVASESTRWSSGVWDPSVTVKYFTEVYTGLTNITPVNADGTVSVGKTLEFQLYSDVTAVAPTNVELKNLTLNEEVALTADDIVFKPYQRKIEISVPGGLSENSQYSVTFKNLENTNNAAFADGTHLFMTGKAVDVKAPVVAEENSIYTVNTIITNNTSTEIDSYILILALYDGNILTGVDIKGMEESPIAPFGTKTLECTIDATGKNVTSARAYVWKQTPLLQPAEF